VTPRARTSSRARTRAAALEAAREEVLATGWDGLQMSAVAARVGVTRQTLHNIFGDKHGLAEALILGLLERFLDGIEEAVAAAHDLEGRWAAVVRYALELAETEPLLTQVLSGTSSDEFLPLLTSDGGPVLRRAGERLVAILGDHHPEIDPRVLRPVADTVTRLTISHIVLPLDPPSAVAAHVGALAAAGSSAAVPHAAG
jgi:AcrR family transcriptional regulator